MVHRLQTHLALVYCVCRKYLAVSLGDHLISTDRYPTNLIDLKVTSHVEPHNEMAVVIRAACQLAGMDNNFPLACLLPLYGDFENLWWLLS